MPTEIPPPRPLRIIGPGEPAPPRSRGPGLAVYAIAAYALAFFAALWFLRAHSPIFRKPEPPAAVSSDVPAQPSV